MVTGRSKGAAQTSARQSATRAAGRVGAAWPEPTVWLQQQLCQTQLC
jgi:hypothetical protein